MIQTQALSIQFARLTVLQQGQSGTVLECILISGTASDNMDYESVW